MIYNRQKKLKLDIDQSITVVGCGGIGYWVAKFAAMSGIDIIYVFDPDIIEIHNLNRLDLPEKFVGRNKSDVVRIVVNSLRPMCSMYSMPYRFTEVHDTDTTWLVDCTDNYESQVENQRIANIRGMRYLKAGYDGEQFSINNVVAEWGDVEDGYRVVPSWVVPSVVVASLTVAKILKYKYKEAATTIENMFLK